MLKDEEIFHGFFYILHRAIVLSVTTGGRGNTKKKKKILEGVLTRKTTFSFFF
jgi:hypothetical protein